MQRTTQCNFSNFIDFNKKFDIILISYRPIEQRDWELKRDSKRFKITLFLKISTEKKSVKYPEMKREGSILLKPTLIWASTLMTLVIALTIYILFSLFSDFFGIDEEEESASVATFDI